MAQVFVLPQCDAELKECISMASGFPALLTFGLLFTELLTCRDARTHTHTLVSPTAGSLKVDKKKIKD